MAMKIEKYSDGIHISGYVNITGTLSRPIRTPYGIFIETIEKRAFASALYENKNVVVMLNHDKKRTYARTADGSLKVYEDDTGLFADAFITDSHIIELAHKGRLNGWSFGRCNSVSEIEQSPDHKYPVRHIKSFYLTHISLLSDGHIPGYPSASKVNIR